MIVFAHLLNDRSGSPRVLRSAISALSRQGDGSRLFVGSDGSGCLDDADIEILRYWYRRAPYRWVTLFTFLLSQICLFVRLLRTQSIDRDTMIYINTLLPFGAALYGWIKGWPVTYHLHEVSVSPAPLRWFLTAIARLTASNLIYVSDYHHRCFPVGKIPTHTVHNALDAAFLSRAKNSRYQPRRNERFTVLMLSSLRDYKGVPEFLALAGHLVSRLDIRFELVANDDEAAMRRYFAARPLPPNVTIHRRTSDTAAHYAEASLVLNLSRPDQCVETFGLTLLEAMAFGIPVIAPPVGGPVDLIRDGCEGFLIDCRNGDQLADQVLKLADGEALCLRLSAVARSRASHFTPAAFAQALRGALKLSLLEKEKS
ncbi:MAG: hypothetical protein VR64_22860 [Desulfatitalea sp. BRH_c12]|nr:MAG: hypothetical protein VR64_22860 [Desulfatitalea sp. BRH_c12]